MNFEGFKTDKLKVSDNVEIHYGVNFSIDNIPSRPTVVFNYGLVCNIAHFKYQISYFHDQGYNVIFHDYRFHFESSSTNRRVSNVTAACQAIFIGSGISKMVKKIYKIPPKPQMIKVLRAYKNEQTRESFDDVLKVLRL